MFSILSSLLLFGLSSVGVCYGNPPKKRREPGLIEISHLQVIPRTTKDMNGSTGRVNDPTRSAFKAAPICMKIFSRLSQLASHQNVTSWRWSVDRDGAQVRPERALSARFIVSCGAEIVWKAVTAAYLWSFYATLHFYSILIYRSMRLRTPKSETNELILYSFGWREMLLWLWLIPYPTTLLSTALNKMD